MHSESESSQPNDAPPRTCPFARVAKISPLGEMLQVLRNVPEFKGKQLFTSEYKGASSFLRSGRPHEVARGVAVVMQVIHSDLKGVAVKEGNTLDVKALPQDAQDHIAAFKRAIDEYQEFLEQPIAELLQTNRKEDFSNGLIDHVIDKVPEENRAQFKKDLEKKSDTCFEAFERMMERLNTLDDVPVHLVDPESKDSTDSKIRFTIPNNVVRATQMALLSITHGHIDPAFVPEEIAGILTQYFNDTAVGFTRGAVSKIPELLRDGLRGKRFSEEQCNAIMQASGLTPSNQIINTVMQKHEGALSLFAYLTRIINPLLSKPESTAFALKESAPFIKPYETIRNTHELAAIIDTYFYRLRLDDIAPAIIQQISQQIEDWNAAATAQPLNGLILSDEMVGFLKSIESGLGEPLNKPISALLENQRKLADPVHSRISAPDNRSDLPSH